ncbi:phosphonate degradation HD-domain oxygenase [Verminephrobacter eiseniae]|uniref:HD phosphohydrolase-like protein n=1 Tax=Verminephrobacter eiseniae (strain EF01-2) TaxID=391735 RepID=A1WH51_VEREI|nr:phosphonate degradation HD-domain oxygenase [Verminephrobacter eiseniae]ABM56958.1 HD phosphohydrolase-like protein [Verminephrobacter eiseniae EF01-2]MCW5287300.1 phosphohydrolase [Verminephrobacter eiseniae]MCW5305599.1 phosphohydrolase [Verminephrobacter eiseniae]MCW8178665.1 phosphohydrolase [Verminephrobacter eiseniae]MCW8188594.1 phosphohydrolase [Verminephrobacter eiseniae]
MNPAIADLFDLLRSKGHARYDGEAVTQLEHALQSAQWAERSGADSALIAAALLHDLGHLLHDFDGTPTRQGLDDLHQYRCLPFLRPLFGPATLEPIRLHVDAKRFLCAREPGYLDSLSPDSRRSLALQGGVFDAAQATAFAALPHALDAVRLRRWDDLAKSAGAQTPDLEHFARHLDSSAVSQG